MWHVAIMPFPSGHNVAEHLGPAIAEEVTTRLTVDAPSWVSVVARDSVFTLAQRGLTAVQVGEALHADFVLAGTLVALAHPLPPPRRDDSGRTTESRSGSRTCSPARTWFSILNRSSCSA